jgi:small conductance mechanosensitive channel
MNRMETLCTTWLVLVALLWIPATAGAQRDPHGAAAPIDTEEILGTESPASSEAREASSRLDSIEALRAEIVEASAKLREMEQSALDAKGDDLIALRTLALEKRLEAMAQLRKLVDAVVALEEEGVDASAYRQQLAELLRRVTPALEFQLDAADDSLAKLKKERDAAKPEDRVAAEQKVSRQNAVVGRLLAAGVDLVDMLETLEIEAPEARELVTTRLGDRARITAGRIELVNAQITDAEERQAASPSDAAVQAEILALRSRLDADSAELGSAAALMDQLGMETAEYKQLLIASTGEITTDVFDREVAKGLLAGWADDVKATVTEDGPGFIFKAFLFFLVIFVFWLLSRFVRKVTERAVEAAHLRFSQLLKRMAGLGIAGFILGFALQETLANFAAGVMILAYRPYDVGDMIDCAGGVFGKVSHMSLVSTTILTIDNQTKIVPNGKIWGDVITNVTAQKKRRVDLVFGIGYEDDIAHAEQVMWSAVKEHPKILSDPEPVVKLHELGDSSVNFVVRPWVLSDDYWDVYWDLTREVKLRFDREGVSIPFPQRDVHFYPAQTHGASAPAAPDVAARLGRERTALTGQSEPGAESDT